ncbi:ABC transporter ATP-binding protein [Alicyclobacillus acidocaldarius]|uniref:ABC transporter related protein n=1 Tax=Alicyclobacillus acidocaldarius (strain Tc-4-1) TaxID=1048834 RepID=F8IHI5_ALIAT|nr:ABC transporter ATP-binding protein [Alicyclobacillus acidocaldarius]AEJ44458.1 ABC transporter related protein [Alicyclobacillus acidocaldarius subsp. acidocaldarius Tc-4-1]
MARAQEVQDNAEALLRAPFIYRDDEALEKKLQLSLILRLASYMRPYPKLIALALLATGGNLVVTLLAPYLVGRAVDALVGHRHSHLLFEYAAALVALYLLNFAASFCRIDLTNRLGQRVIQRLRDELFVHVQGLSSDFFDARPAGSILVRILNDVNSLQDLFTNGVINSITNVFTLIGIIAIMFSLNWRLATVALVVVPFMFVLSLRLTVQIRRAWQQVRLRLSRLNAHLAEAIQGMRVTEAYVRADENQTFFEDMNRDYMRTFLRAQRFSIPFGPLVDLTGALGTALLFWYGVHLVHTGVVTVGLLVAFANYLGSFWTPISQLGQLYNQVLVAMASSERIFQYLDTRPTVTDRGVVRELPPVRGHVEFCHVTFAYQPSRLAIEDVSFVARPGETIALVGHTGAGKSTVVNLLARFYDPTSGEIRIDGHDLRSVSLGSLRRQMGMVLQETFLFSGSLIDNIRYGRPNATDEECIAAAKAVYADEFIRRLPDGYFTEVQERGTRLSQGQRQLISFARAILADPRILILDEATASIDTYTEHLIQRALKVLLEGRTSFVVAHRLSTIREADQILVFDGGRIVERGRHDDLMRRRGAYYKLVQAQYRSMMEG